MTKSNRSQEGDAIAVRVASYADFGSIPLPVTPGQCSGEVAVRSNCPGVQQSADEMERAANCLDVRYWHLADIPSCTAHVRYWGQSGHSVLHCKCPLMTQSGHSYHANERPLSGVRRHWLGLASPLPGYERTLSRTRKRRPQRCGPLRLTSRSARKILLWRLAIHFRPFDVTLR